MKSVVSSLLEEQLRPSTQVSLQLQKGDKRFSPTQAQEEHQEIKSTSYSKIWTRAGIKDNAPDGSIVFKDQSRDYTFPCLEPFSYTAGTDCPEESALSSSLQNLLTQIKTIHKRITVVVVSFIHF